MGITYVHVRKVSTKCSWYKTFRDSVTDYVNGNRRAEDVSRMFEDSLSSI